MGIEKGGGGLPSLYHSAIAGMAVLVAAFVAGMVIILWPRRPRANEYEEHMGEWPRVPEYPEVNDGRTREDADMGCKAGAFHALPEHHKPGAHLPDKVEEAPCGRSTRTTQA